VPACLAQNSKKCDSFVRHSLLNSIMLFGVTVNLESRVARSGLGSFATQVNRVAAPSIRFAKLASCWPLPQQFLPVSATGGGRRCCRDSIPRPIACGNRVPPVGHLLWQTPRARKQVKKFPFAHRRLPNNGTKLSKMTARCKKCIIIHGTTARKRQHLHASAQDECNFKLHILCK